MLTEEQKKWHWDMIDLARKIIDQAADNFEDWELEIINGEMDGGEDMGALGSVVNFTNQHDDAHWEDLVPDLVKYANLLRNKEEIAEMQGYIDQLIETKGALRSKSEATNE